MPRCPPALFWRAVVAFLALPAIVAYAVPWQLRPPAATADYVGTTVVAAGTILQSITIGDHGGDMHCVLWTYAVPPALSEDAIRRQFEAVADRYLAVPGLIRKYFGFTEDAKSVMGIYLWTSRETAEAFYTPAWMAGVTERWGTAPVKTEWVVPVVAESAEGRVVSAG